MRPLSSLLAMERHRGGFALLSSGNGGSCRVRGCERLWFARPCLPVISQGRVLLRTHCSDVFKPGWAEERPTKGESHGWGALEGILGGGGMLADQAVWKILSAWCIEDTLLIDFIDF